MERRETDCPDFAHFFCARARCSMHVLARWHGLVPPVIKGKPREPLRKIGRSGGIRTHDPYTPSVVRYQTAPRSGPWHRTPPGCLPGRRAGRTIRTAFANGNNLPGRRGPMIPEGVGRSSGGGAQEPGPRSMARIFSNSTTTFSSSPRWPGSRPLSSAVPGAGAA